MKKSLLNVTIAILFKILYFVGGFLVRRYLIRFLGNEINGLNSLYISIIGVLSVAELGIGSAITYCMYKPIVEGDVHKVSALYNLIKKMYIVIGIVIGVAGCAMIPILPYLAKGYRQIGANLYLTFALTLVSTVLTYFYNSKISLMNAYRDDYIATTITSSGQILQQILQIVVLFTTKSFIWYLGIAIISVVVIWIITEIVSRKRYYFSDINNKRYKIDKETKVEVVKNIKARFSHGVGGVLVNTIDSLVISAFIGVNMLGKYSNYSTIIISLQSILIMFFTPLTSTIGHLFVKDKIEAKKYYNFFCSFNFIIGCVFFLGYYSIADNIVVLFFGEGLGLGKTVVLIITLNRFIQFMRQTTLLFRDASGTFYYDRWKPYLEGFTNLLLSIIFVLFFKSTFGEEFAVAGVLVATIVTNIFICHIAEPYVLHKYAFNCSMKRYSLRNYGCIILFTGLLFLLDACMLQISNSWLELLANGSIAVGISLIPISSVFIFDKDFRHFAGNILRKIKIKLKGSKT